ncbi:MAG: AAA family ATPase, partial [Candidatus Nitrosomaritimum yanchengensis]
MSFVITGSPGVGKHTITKEISKILNLPVFDINQIAKEKNLFERTDETNDVDV